MDIFEIIGPIMVGPSSSHTAGAVRIGLVARKLLARPPVRAELLLHGSFAATGRGHGTDRALVAGLLGFEPDDTRIPDSFVYAKEAGLDFRFDTVELRDAHPNSVLLRLWAEPDGKPMEVVGASIGGGRIEIRASSPAATSILQLSRSTAAQGAARRSWSSNVTPRSVRSSLPRSAPCPTSLTLSALTPEEVRHDFCFCHKSSCRR